MSILMMCMGVEMIYIYGMKLVTWFRLCEYYHLQYVHHRQLIICQSLPLKIYDRFA